MQATIQARQASHDEWLIAKPVQAAGKPAFSTDTLETHIGDGVKRWSELPPIQLQNPMYTLYAGLEPNVIDGRRVVGDRRVTTVGAMTTTIFSGGDRENVLFDTHERLLDPATMGLGFKPVASPERVAVPSASKHKHSAMQVRSFLKLTP